MVGGAGAGPRILGARHGYSDRMAHTTIPDSHRDLLEGQVLTLATVGEDGYPQVSEVWFVVEDDQIAMSLNTRRQKVKNLETEPACTVLLLDLQNPYRYLEIRGTAVIAPDEDRAFAEKVGAKYNADLREHDAPGDRRVDRAHRPRPRQRRGHERLGRSPGRRDAGVERRRCGVAGAAATAAAPSRTSSQGGPGREHGGEHHGGRQLAGHHDAQDDGLGSGEAPVEGGEGGRARDAPPEQDGQPADQAEQRADGQRGAGTRGQGGQDDHEVERRRLDVGDQARADLPAEPRPVDPRAELVEPALVDLAGVDREAEPAEPACRRPRPAAAATPAMAASDRRSRARRRGRRGPARPWRGRGSPRRPARPPRTRSPCVR